MLKTNRPTLTAWYDYESDCVCIHTHGDPTDKRCLTIHVDDADEVGAAIIKLGHEANDQHNPFEIPAQFGTTVEP